MARLGILGEIGRGLGGLANALRQNELDAQNEALKWAHLDLMAAQRELERERLAMEREAREALRAEKEQKERERQEALQGIQEAATEMEQLYGVPSNVLIKLSKASPALPSQILLQRVTQPEETYHTIDGVLLKIPKRGGQPEVVYKGTSPLERQIAVEEYLSKKRDESTLVPVFNRMTGQSEYVTRSELKAGGSQYAPLQEQRVEDKTNVINKIISDPIMMALVKKNPDTMQKLYGLSDDQMNTLMEVISGFGAKSKQPTPQKTGKQLDESMAKKLIFGESGSTVVKPMPPVPTEEELRKK